MIHPALVPVTAALQRLIAAEKAAAQARLERDEALWEAKRVTGLSTRVLAEQTRQDMAELGYPAEVVRLSHDTVRNAVEGERPSHR